MDTNKLIEELKQYGTEIGKCSSKEAKRIMEYYNLWYKCPGDLTSAALIEEELKNWKKNNGY